MALFTARQRPRLTRSSTSFLRKKEREMYMYMYMLALALLLVVSVFFVLFSSSRSSEAHEAADAEHVRKGSSGGEKLRGGSRNPFVPLEKYKETKDANRKKLAEMFKLSKDWKMKREGKKGGGYQWIKDGGEVRYFSDDDVVEFDAAKAEEGLNELYVYTDKGRLFQGQQLDDMDKFDVDDVMGNVFQHQGQLLEDMDKFDNHQVTDNSEKHEFAADTNPQFMQEKFLQRMNGFRGRDRKWKSQTRVEKEAEGSSSGNLQSSMEKSRLTGEGSKDVLNMGRESEELESSDKVGGSPLRSENGTKSVKRTYEAAKGSIRAAIEEEMEKRNGVILRENSTDSEEQAGAITRLKLWETTSDPSLSHVKSSAEKSVETGMPSLRGFKEFSDSNEPLNRMDVKSADAVIFDEGTLESRTSNPWDIQNGKFGVVNSANTLNVKKNKGTIMESSGSVQVQNSTSEQYDHDKNSTMKTEVSQPDKEGQLDHDEDVKVEEESESTKNNDDDGSALEEKEDDDHDNMIHWGFYPTLSSNLKFSKFLSAFFKQEHCSLRIFMAWTTAPWAFTPRHQRAIESVLKFHPQACIVVFTETVDFKFFESWVKEGYKIAVARPNLEELLGHTPAIDFAYVWYEWRSMNLFYIHYTELLRIAALHKYGGVWLDMDVILARPLPKLHNVLGSTVSKSGEWVLNGAFMSFDKSSPFLKACIEEFVATYDETSLGWNGADLLNRVASNATKKGGKEWLESEYLQVLEPIAFFPLSRHNIISYFSVPRKNHERVEQTKMLSAIQEESFGIHLWNSVTGRHVPEVGSLVEKLLNRNCIRCTDIL